MVKTIVAFQKQQSTPNTTVTTSIEFGLLAWQIRRYITTTTLLDIYTFKLLYSIHGRSVVRRRYSLSKSSILEARDPVKHGLEMMPWIRGC